MNLLIRKTGLLLIGAVLFLFSCDKTSELLLDPGTDSNKIGTYYLDSFTINTQQVILNTDSISTRGIFGGSSNNWLLVGEYNDSYLSSIKAGTYTMVAPWIDPKFTSGDNYQSFKIYLDFDYKFGKGDDDLSFSIYELKDTLNSRKLYNTLDNAELKYPALATFKKISPSALNKDGGISIDLSDIRGSELFNDLKSNPLDTPKFLKGFALLPDPGNKAVWGIDPDSSYVYFTYKEDTAVKLKAVSIPIGYYSKFNHIDADVAQKKVAPNPAYTYVQSSTGLATRISFPSITKLKGQTGKVAINKAVLIIEPEDDPGISPPSNLFLIERSNTTKEFSPHIDDVRFPGSIGNLYYPATNYKAVQSAINGVEQTFNTNAVNLIYNSTSNVYAADITSYVEAIIDNVDGRFDNNDLLLYSEARGQVVNQFMSYSLDNGQLVYFKDMSINRAVIQKEKIKLKIYYTLVP